MIFTPPLIEATFIKRYKRFFADIITPQGKPLTIHVPNTGSMKGCLQEGAPCLYTPSTDPKRKLKGTLQFLKTDTSWVGVNTSLPNTMVKEFFDSKQANHWEPFTYSQQEYKINDKSRLDMVLARDEEHFAARQNLHFVEIKNVTMAENQTALFPDAVTTRGQKHLEELMLLQKQGHTSEIFFLIQRTDCTHFAPCAKIDKKYATLLKQAHEEGVKLSAYAFTLDIKKGVGIANSPLKIAPF